MSITIPDRLHDLSFRFVLIQAKNKSPVEKDWPYTANYHYGNPRLLEHLDKDGNYGVLCGFEGLTVIDADSPDVSTAVEESLPQTFTVQTGRGGYHFYYRCADLPGPLRLARPGDAKGTIGDVQSTGKQVIGPGSIHPNGNAYVVLKDLPIASIKAEQIKTALSDFLPPPKTDTQEDIERELPNISRDVDLDSLRVQDVIPMDGLKGQGGKFRGSCPWHGSNTGHNFEVDISKNAWYCFRHGTGGGPLHAIAVQEKVLDCGDCVPGTLRGEKFMRTLEIAQNKHGLKYSPERKKHLIKHEKPVNENTEIKPLDGEESTTEEEECKKKERNPASKLLKLAEDVGQVFAFIDQRGDPYVRIMDDGSPFIMRLNKKDPGEFGDWLTRMSWDNHNGIPKEDHLKQVIRLLRARALKGENVRPLFNRVAEYGDSFMYYLSDQRRRAIEVNSNGWQLIDKPPVLFKHFPHMLPQDEPQVSDGTYLDKFVNGLNLSKDGKTMYKINLATDFIPGIAHIGISFDGPNGSTKSTLLWAEKMLIDPSSIDLMPPFKDRKELHRAMDRHYIVPLDNISHITREMSDDLSRGITGIAIPSRGLYSDDDDFTRKFKVIVRLNGISQEVKESDLLSRLLLESVPELDKSKMRGEKEVKGELMAWRPYILGELLTIVSKAMTIKPRLTITTKPRMSDWYTWAIAVSIAMGMKQEDFETLYQRYEEKQHGEAINQSPVASLIKEASRETLSMDCCHGTYATATELLHSLVKRAKDLELNTRVEGWPTDPTNLGKLLKRLTKDLRSQGVVVLQGFKHEQLTKECPAFKKDPRIISRRYGPKDRIIVVLSETDYKEVFGGTGVGTGRGEQTMFSCSEGASNAEKDPQEQENSKFA